MFSNPFVLFVVLALAQAVAHPFSQVVKKSENNFSAGTNLGLWAKPTSGKERERSDRLTSAASGLWTGERIRTPTDRPPGFQRACPGMTTTGQLPLAAKTIVSLSLATGGRGVVDPRSRHLGEAESGRVPFRSRSQRRLITSFGLDRRR